jgi:phosphoglucosamine mutase
MTPELVMRLGRAVTLVARRGKTRPPRIVIGKDTRLSGYMLETAMASGICAMGGHVLLSGPVPTPAVANLTQSMRADAGVVISASHNPFADNGIKIFGPDGYKLPDAEEAAIETLLEDPKLDTATYTGARVGRAERLEDATGRYIVFTKSTFPKDLTLDGIRVVVDAAHGAAYRCAPEVFAELGAEVTSLGCRPNGRNINRGCGALHPEHVVKEVKRKKATIGIALDGDADRVIIVDEHGEIVDGDAVMALCATRMLREGRLARGTLVATVMSNMGLEQAMRRAGGKLVRTAVGDRYVVEQMRAENYSLGGEQSGHLIFSEHATTGDGVIAALQVLAIMVREQKPLSELSTVMQRMPQVLESALFSTRRPIEEMSELGRHMGAAEQKLGQQGRLLVRWSGTEPKLRVMLEGPDVGVLQELAAELIGAARKDLTVAG